MIVARMKSGEPISAFRMRGKAGSRISSGLHLSSSLRKSIDRLWPPVSGKFVIILEAQGAHVYGLASSMSDVLHHVCLERVLACDDEVDWAIGHPRAQTLANDLLMFLMFDRNYPSDLLISLRV